MRFHLRFAYARLHYPPFPCLVVYTLFPGAFHTPLKGFTPYFHYTRIQSTRLCMLYVSVLDIFVISTLVLSVDQPHKNNDDSVPNCSSLFSVALAC